MNPKDKVAAIELLAEIGLLPKPTPAMAEEACESVRGRVKKLTESVASIYAPLTPTKQMSSISSGVGKVMRGQAHPTISITYEALLTMSLWAVAFNKTMPEAMDVYCNLLKEGAK